MASKLDELLLAGNGLTMTTLRNKLIPQKVSLFIWRTRLKRIPVRVELDKRGVDLDSVLCPLCSDAPESVEHAMFSCAKVREIWDGIARWWGCNLPLNLDFDSLFAGNFVSGFSGAQKELWNTVIWVSGYFIWKNKNQKVFAKDSWGAPKILNEIQVKTYEWINNRSKRFNLTCYEWLMNPQVSASHQHTCFDPG
ncbi:uncharacterized protein [Rutidosis leptorrhynchoides]|uniref:uncharacterized protein n=1 Tax=Rutidosis leptorrhynchoides TaxID=125765 RepID=UPI003A99E9EB